MFGRRGIAWRMIIMVLLGAGCILASIVGYGYVHTRAVLKGDLEDRVRGVAEATAAQMEQVSVAVETVASDLALVMDHFDPSSEEIYPLLRELLRRYSSLSGAAVAFSPDLDDPLLSHQAPFVYRDGDELISMDLGSGGYDRKIQDWFFLPRYLERAVWTEPYFGTGGSERLLVTRSVPIYRGHGRKRTFLASVVCDISLDWLTDLLASLDIDGEGYPILISGNGVFISHPDHHYIMNETIFSLAEARGDAGLADMGRRMIRGESGFLPFVSQLDGRQSWLTFVPVSGTGWSLGIVFPREVLLARIADFSRSQLLLGVGGFALLLLIALLIARSITGPVRQLSAATEVLAAGDLNADLPVIRGEDEVAHLARSFSAMRTSLVDHVERLKESTAARERIESELNIAHSIQMSLVPRTFPPFPNRGDFDLYALLDPAREVGGDFYDFFMVDEDHLCLVIGDVSGKGVPAALFMAVTRTFLKAFSGERSTPSTIMARLNDELSQGNDSCMFVTLFCAVVDLRNGSLRYASGGHNPPFLIRNGDVTFLPRVKGALVGAMPGIAFGEGETVLAPGDCLFLYTDGVTEAMNSEGELMGETLVASSLEKLAGLSSRDLVNSMRGRISSFAGGAEQSDDVTMLSFVYSGRIDATAEKS